MSRPSAPLLSWKPYDEYEWQACVHTIPKVVERLSNEPDQQEGRDQRKRIGRHGTKGSDDITVSKSQATEVYIV